MTSPVGVLPTTPAYLTPSELPAAFQTNDLQTNELRRKRQKRNIIVVVSMMAVMILALAGLLVFLSFGVDRPVVVAPSDPAVTGVRPPDPPIPPGAPSKIDPSLIYPNSEQTLSVEESGKSVLQLHSNDSSRRVTDWYLARLKTTKKVTFAGQTILQSGDLTVLIFGGDTATEITITREK